MGRGNNSRQMFTHVPNWVLESNDIDKNEILVILSILYHGSVSFPSIHTIVRHSKLSESSVHRAIKSLSDKGYLKVCSRLDDRGNQTSNGYVLVSPIEQERYGSLIDTVQDEKYSIDAIKRNIDYYNIYSAYPTYRDYIDICVDIIYEMSNVIRKTSLHIGQADISSEIVKSKMQKLTSDDVIYSIKCYLNVDKVICNPKDYLTVTLYNAKSNMHLEYVNKARVM